MGKATEDFLRQHDRKLGVHQEIDLGELVFGHHVVITGLELTTRDTVVHYEFRPAVSRSSSGGFDPRRYNWKMSVSDDVGSDYSSKTSGAFDADSSGTDGSHGMRYIGTVPVEASYLLLVIRPAKLDQPVDEPIELKIDLKERKMTRLARR
jgi:hypothetical protein